MGVSRELNATGEKDRALRHTLKLMEGELRDINATVAHKQQLMEDYRSSGFAGSQHAVFFPQLTFITVKLVYHWGEEQKQQQLAVASNPDQ